MNYTLTFTHNGQPITVKVQGPPETLVVREIIEKSGYTVECQPPLPPIEGFRKLFGVE